MRIRVKGGTRLKSTNVLQFRFVGAPEKQPPKAVEFVEEGFFAKNDFRTRRVSYVNDSTCPRWRLEASLTAH